MARLPRYQRLGVKARQPQSIDFAGFREQANVGTAISRSFDQMSEFLYKTAAQEAEKRGVERLRTEGAQPILEAMRQQGGPRGIEETAAYEAANRVAVAEVQSEAELEITKILDTAQINKTSFSAVQSQLKDVTDGFPAALSDIDPVSAGVLRARLQETAGKAEMRYSKFYAGEQLKNRKVKQNAVSANEAEFIIGNATVPGYTIDEIDLDIASAVETLQGLGIKQELIDTWADNTRNKAIKERSLFEFYQKPLDEQRQTIEGILSGEETLDGMDFETSVRFVNGLLRPEYNRNLAVVEAQSDLVVDNSKEQTDILESGGRLSQEVLASMSASASDVAEFDGGVAKKAVDDLVAADQFYSELRNLPLSGVEQRVLELQAGIEGAGGEGRDTAIEQTYYERATKFLDNMEKGIKEDPMGYAERVGFIERAPMISLDENNRVQIDEQALEARVLDAKKVANFYGLSTPNLLFANEAREVALMLDKVDGQAKLDILGALSSFDAAAGQVLTQIADYSPELAMVGALVNQGSTEAARIAVAGLDRLKTGEKIVEFTPTNTDPVVQDLFQRAIITPEMSKAIKGVAKAIYAELSVSKGLDQFDQDTYVEALQMAAGQTVKNGVVRGGIQEIRGVQTFIDPALTADQTEKMLNELTPALVASVTGQTMTVRLADEINKNEEYHLRNVGGDKYAIFYGKKGEVSVSDKEGTPIILSMSEFRDAVAQGLPRPNVPKTRDEIIDQAPKLYGMYTSSRYDRDAPFDPASYGIPSDSPFTPEADLPPVELGKDKQFLTDPMQTTGGVALEKFSRMQLRQNMKEIAKETGANRKSKRDSLLVAKYINEIPTPGMNSEELGLVGKYIQYLGDASNKIIKYADWKKTQ